MHTQPKKKRLLETRLFIPVKEQLAVFVYDIAQHYFRIVYYFIWKHIHNFHQV